MGVTTDVSVVIVEALRRLIPAGAGVIITPPVYPPFLPGPPEGETQQPDPRSFEAALVSSSANSTASLGRWSATSADDSHSGIGKGVGNQLAVRLPL